jgi:hypothetical protein
MKFALRIVLWLGAIALTIFGLLLMAGALDSSGSDAAGRGLSQAYGMFIALLGGAAVLSRLLTRFWRGFLVIGCLFLSLPFVLMLLLSVGRSVQEQRNDQSPRTCIPAATTLASTRICLGRTCPLERSSFFHVKFSVRPIANLA